MSINDLLESEIVLPMLLLLGVALFIGIPYLIKFNEKQVYGDSSNNIDKKEVVAIVVDKRTENNYLTRNVQVNILTFQLENGERIEFALRDSTTIIIGDKGLLTYSGKRFISFARKEKNED